MNWKRRFAVVGALALLAGPASGVPLDATSMDLSVLQRLFDCRTAPSPNPPVDCGAPSNINVNTDETGSEAFAFTGAGSSSAAYMATVNFGGALEFGLYDQVDPTNKVTLFDTSGGSGEGDLTNIFVEFGAGNTVLSFTLEPIPVFPGLALVPIDSAVFAGDVFGFYLTSGGTTVYTESDLNPTAPDVDGDGVADNDHFLTYSGTGDQVDSNSNNAYLSDFGHYYVAGEVALNDWNPNDFTDFVVQLESIQSVAEPTSLLLVGAGLLGLAGRARRRRLAHPRLHRRRHQRQTFLDQRHK